MHVVVLYELVEEMLSSSQPVMMALGVGLSSVSANSLDEA